jgi:hypothetical protein
MDTHWKAFSMSHGGTGRDPAGVPTGPIFKPGLFGRLFPCLPPLAAADDDLETLADAMKETFDPGNPTAGDNPTIPAGYTYLGQFVDHDITLDTTSLGEAAVDPLAVHNFRTPKLDLDSVYGQGPGVSRHLYQRGDKDKLLIGTTVQAFQDLGNVPAGLPNDLPRNREGFALIGDHRNDENLLVAQTHLAFLKFHNKIVDHLRAGPNPPAPGALFNEARRLMTWHYQWIVLHDFVKRLVGPGTVTTVLQQGRQFYHFDLDPFMPLEFSVAAYRLGHSMVREVYSHNRIFTPNSPLGAPAGSLGLLFAFSGLSGQLIGDAAPTPLTGPLPAPVLPSNWIIDWRRFYDFHTPAGANVRLNLSRKLDPFIVPALHTLPGEAGREAKLPFRNLRRGVMMKLPSGQAVAGAMQLSALTPAQIASGPDGQVAQQLGFDQQTPLWYYILKEAKASGGNHLGAVGSRILAEVFVGLLQGDSLSFLSQQPNWTPTLPAKTPGTFEMTDLLQFVGEISPVDGITTVNTL